VGDEVQGKVGVGMLRSRQEGTATHDRVPEAGGDEGPSFTSFSPEASNETGTI